MGVGTTKINIYHIIKCGDKCVASEDKVVTYPNMTAFSAVLWCDGTFFVLDVCGNVYIVKKSNYLFFVISKFCI